MKKYSAEKLHISNYCAKYGLDFTQVLAEYEGERLNNQKKFIDHIMQDGGQVAPQDQMSQIISMFAEISGKNPEEIMATLQNLSEQEQQGAVEQMVQAIQQAHGSEENGEQNSNMQEESQEMKFGGDAVSKMGYRDDSPFRFADSNLINSNSIDMSATGIPLMGVSDTGHVQFMKPYSGKYEFGGESVTEYPIAQAGGDYSRQLASLNEQLNKQRAIFNKALLKETDVRKKEAIEKAFKNQEKGIVQLKVGVESNLRAIEDAVKSGNFKEGQRLESVIGENLSNLNRAQSNLKKIVPENFTSELYQREIAGIPVSTTYAKLIPKKGVGISGSERMSFFQGFSNDDNVIKFDDSPISTTEQKKPIVKPPVIGGKPDVKKPPVEDHNIKRDETGKLALTPKTDLQNINLKEMSSKQVTPLGIHNLSTIPKIEDSFSKIGQNTPEENKPFDFQKATDLVNKVKSIGNYFGIGKGLKNYQIASDLRAYNDSFNRISPVKQQVDFKRVTPQYINADPQLADLRSNFANITQNLNPDDTRSISQANQLLTNVTGQENQILGNIQNQNNQIYSQNQATNADIANKEKMQNLQFDKNYINEVLQTTANQDLQRNNALSNIENKRLQNDQFNANLNLLKASSPQYNVDTSGNVYHDDLAPDPEFLNSYGMTSEDFKKAPKEQQDYLKQLNAKALLEGRLLDNTKKKQEQLGVAPAKTKYGGSLNKSKYFIEM